MKKLLILVTTFTFLNAGNINPETGWEYQQSVFQSFYILESIEVDGSVAETGDVIGAFREDGVCVGWTYALEGFTTVPLMGQDTGIPGMSAGDVADLLIYDL